MHYLTVSGKIRSIVNGSVNVVLDDVVFSAHYFNPSMIEGLRSSMLRGAATASNCLAVLSAWNCLSTVGEYWFALVCTTLSLV